MSVFVEIADRLYDYTNEEKATEAVAVFQEELRLSDTQIIDLWSDEVSPRRSELEKAIFYAVDANGSLSGLLKIFQMELSFISYKTPN